MATIVHTQHFATTFANEQSNKYKFCLSEQSLPRWQKIVPFQSSDLVGLVITHYAVTAYEVPQSVQLIRFSFE